MVGISEVSRWGKVSTRRSGGQTRSQASRKLNIHVISDGITRLPILEGEISHIELPREKNPLGITIVGGADTPLRCVVVQEVFPDGFVAQDGRLLPGDQIIEVDGVDMTAATHQQVCDALRKSFPILRLGVYRERIEAYKLSPVSVASSSSASSEATFNGQCYFEYQNEGPREPYYQNLVDRGLYETFAKEIAVTIHLQRHSGRHLGIKLGERRNDPGVYIVEIMAESIAEQDKRLRVQDRILSINGEDIRDASLEYASNLVHMSKDYVNFGISRSNASTPRKKHDSLSQDSLFGYEENDPSFHLSGSSSLSDQASECSTADEDRISFTPSVGYLSPQSLPPEVPSTDGTTENNGLEKRIPTDIEQQHIYGTTDGIIEKRIPTDIEQQHLYGTREGSLEKRIPTDIDQQHIYNGQNYSEKRHDVQPNTWNPSLGCYDVSVIRPKAKQSVVNGISQVFGRRKEEPPVLRRKEVRLKKGMNEGLGMRIGGGLSSNEGDTPIYVANINIQGPAGKSRQIKKGDVVLSVNQSSLLGLTHSQAVSLLKATAQTLSVTLTLLEGPESCTGPSNFVPSWLYWQRLPRSLHLSKSVLLYRPQGASLGFSIVGGNDPHRGTEPIHVLFVVSTSPAAVDGRLRCGDRLLAVDGHCLENVSHATAVSLLKQAGQRVALEVVSWMGTEL